jgi:hypothetical protein
MLNPFFLLFDFGHSLDHVIFSEYSQNNLQNRFLKKDFLNENLLILLTRFDFSIVAKT